MKKLVFAFSILALFVLSACGPGEAVASLNEDVEIWVRDQVTRKPVVNARVVVYKQGVLVGEDYTDSLGKAFFPKLPIDAYYAEVYDNGNLIAKKFFTSKFVSGPRPYVIGIYALAAPPEQPTAVTVDLQATELGSNQVDYKFNLNDLYKIITKHKNLASTGVGPFSIKIVLYDADNNPVQNYWSVESTSPATLPTSLGAGQETTVVWYVKFLKAGAYTIRFIVDSANQIAETNENNNILWAQATVTLCGNNNCDAGETLTCPQDCPAPECNDPDGNDIHTKTTANGCTDTCMSAISLTLPTNPGSFITSPTITISASLGVNECVQSTSNPSQCIPTLILCPTGEHCIDGKCTPNWCGNAVCNSGETTQNCPHDCPPPCEQNPAFTYWFYDDCRQGPGANPLTNTGTPTTVLVSCCTPDNAGMMAALSVANALFTPPNNEVKCNLASATMGYPSVWAYVAWGGTSSPLYCPEEYCGDGTCNAGETTSNCPADCPAPAPVCNNDNNCQASLGENYQNCWDCCQNNPNLVAIMYPLCTFGGATPSSCYAMCCPTGSTGQTAALNACNAVTTGPPTYNPLTCNPATGTYYGYAAFYTKCPQ